MTSPVTSVGTAASCCRDERCPPRTIQPSPRSRHRARCFAQTRPFERFGRWGETISIARDGTVRQLARWMALARHESEEWEPLWQRCLETNPRCFRTYRVLELDGPSFFLPQGEVAFEVLENPTQIPDAPPQGVMLRHLEALDAFPQATFYFLRPVFVSEPYFRLASVDELRSEAYFDQYDAIRHARWFGGLYRAQAQAQSWAQQAALVALRGTVQVVEALSRSLGADIPDDIAWDPAAGRRLQRGLEYRLTRTESLGLHQESVRLRVALHELRRRMAVDPVLCFELPDRPGELWFEAHWFEGIDRRVYVHF